MTDGATLQSGDYRPDITVATLVVRDGRFLMVEEEVRGARVLNQPAGHVEPGETLLAAAARETLEETGWQVRPNAFVGAYQWHATAEDLPGAGAAPEAYLRFVFAAEPGQQQQRALDAGILRALWLSPSELRAASTPLRSPLVLAAIEDFLGGQRWPLTMLHCL